MYRRLNVIGVALALAALGLTACSSSSPKTSSSAAKSSPSKASAKGATTQAWEAGAPPQWQSILQKARQEGSVTVAGYAPLQTPLTSAFEKDTGIKLNWAGGNSGTQSSLFQESAAAHKESIDVLLGGGSPLVTMQPAGLLQPIAPQLILPNVTNGKNWTLGHIKYLDSQTNTYAPQGSNWVFGYLVVNPKFVNVSAISKSWQSLLSPKYKGKMVAYDPTVPGPGDDFAAWLAKEFGVNYLKSLYVGQKMTIVENNETLIEDVARGVYPIGLAVVQSEVQQFNQQGFGLKVVFPANAPGYETGGYSTVFEAKGAPHPAAAQVFINWYLSTAGQTAYSGATLEQSARDDVHVPTIPSYIAPRPGVKYFDSYSEPWYTTQRSQFQKIVQAALGGR